ncbi:MAG: hypothetical protein UHX00_07890 [Caryophanon sp.]|nr:hypothetical protein [Caryophanon sp.]
MKKRFLISAAFALTLAACSNEEVKPKEETEPKQEEEAKVQATETEEHHEEEHESFTRFVATSDTAIHIFNDHFEQIQTIEAANASAVQIAHSPFALLKHTEAAQPYQFMHTGVWSEDHGDHEHPYAEDARLLDAMTENNKPAHVVSFNNQVAVFNDDSGAVQVYKTDEHAIDNTPTFQYEFKGTPHHGVAIPLPQNELAVSFVAKEGDALPTGVKIVNDKGEEQSRITETCTDLHGAAYVDNTLAFGCVGSVVLYDVATKETKEIALKEEGSRVGTIKFAHDSDYLLTNYSIGKEPATEVGIIHRSTGELTYVTIPVAYKSALYATKDKGYVLAEDGYLYEIDFKTATISTKIHAFNAFDLATEAPTIFEANDQLYVMMPSYQKVYEVHGNHTHEVAKLDFIPTSFIVK